MRSMSPAARLVLVLGLSLVVVFTAAVGATAAAIYRAGAIVVEVESEGGSDLSIRVPAGLAELAIAIVPVEPLREFTEELDPWAEELGPVWPAVRESYRELVEAPDFVLVEVQGTDESVVVRKEGTRLVVVVSSNDERVHVAVPLRIVRRALDKLGPGLLAG